MAAMVGKYAARKLLGSEMDKFRHKKVGGDDDPYFTKIPGRNGKMKKVKKQIPDYIPDHDAQVLARAKKVAYRLDMALFTLCGIRFGWSSVVGIIPGAGDVIDLLLAYWLFTIIKEVDGGLPASVQSRMTLNLGIDFALGFVPILGDLADAAFRCNTKNVSLLEAHLKSKYGPSDLKAQKVSGLEPFDDDPDFDRPNHGTATATGGYGSVNGPRQGQPQQQRVQQNPGQAVVQPSSTGKKWYHFGGSKSQDVESGHN